MASTQTHPSDRVFADSSVLYAAAYSARGSAFDLITAGIAGEFRLSLSPFVLTETERNIVRKAPQALTAYQALASILASYLVSPTPAVVRRVAERVHPKDAPIVAGALAARARYLATYDRRHLLHHADDIRAAFGLLVLTPADVIASLREASR